MVLFRFVYSMVWYDMVQVRYDIWYDMQCYAMANMFWLQRYITWYGSAGYMVWYSMVWYGMIYDMA